MGSARRALLAALAMLLLVLGGDQAGAAPPKRVRATGTYRLLAKDVVVGGALRHVYEDVLDANGRMYRLRLPKGHRLRSGQNVTVSADTVDGSDLSVTTYEPLSAAATTATTGTTTVLVILAYWTAPDSVTTQRAYDQILGDDDRWFREVSYGAVGLSGSVTPWVRIAAPTDGLCYVHADEIMTRAKARASALGFDPVTFDRTIVYFPRCTGSDTANVAGWAYEPGANAWLNGYMDRRTSVHEQGHNYGMGHAHSYACTSGGTRVTLGGTCTKSEYGDPFDAMGQSAYAAHFSGYNKDVAGWLGSRKRILATSSASFTLPPYESASASQPQVVVVNSPTRGRSYWLEYRRPSGYDAALPAGATGGVLVHLRDPAVGGGSYLLDGTAGDATFSTAVVRSGTSWTAPDGVKVAVGTVTSTGAPVTVTGARPEPTVPTAPRSFTATARDESADLAWAAPLSDGGEPVTSYRVVAESSYDYPRVMSAPSTARSLRFTGLANGVSYTFRVTAVNSVGQSTAATATATPAYMPPSVAVAAPAAGATVGGMVTIRAAVAPNALTGLPVTTMYVYVDGSYLGQAFASPWSISWNTMGLRNGPHEIAVQAYDSNSRGAWATATVTVDNPYPEPRVTSPANGSSFDGDSLVLESEVTIPARSAATVTRVVYDLGWGLQVEGGATAPYRAVADVSRRYGETQVTAYAYDSSGLVGASAPARVTIVHPPPTVSITSPSDGATVSGTSVTVTADAEVTANGSAVERVRFRSDYTVIGEDTTAPYSIRWDTSGVTGPHTLVADVIETSTRTARSAPVRVNVANNLPGVSLAVPGAYDALQAKPLTFSGTAGASTPRAVARVAVTVDGVEVPSAIDGDGPWTAQWDGSGRYGLHRVEVVAYDVNGLVSPTLSRQFYVVRNPPVVTWASPAGGALVPGGSVLDVAAAVAPGEWDSTSVASVCYVEDVPWYAYGTQLGCGTRGEDGRWHAPYTVTRPDGTLRIAAVVWMSDGMSFTLSGPTVTVARPPLAPRVEARPGDGHTVELRWTQPASVAPVTSWLVSVDGGAPATVTSPSTTLYGLSTGTMYELAVSAVNAVGTGPPGTTWVVPGTRTSLAITKPTTNVTVTYGGRVAVTARLSEAADETGSVTGQPVDLRFCPGNRSCAFVARAVTSSTGTVAFSFVPRTSGMIVLYHPNSGDYVESWAEWEGIVVATKVTGTLSATRVPLGATAYLRGTVTPARTGGFVYLQRYYSGAWHNVTYRTMSSTGAVSVPIKVGRGTYTYRLRYGGDGGRVAGASPARVLTVY